MDAVLADRHFFLVETSHVFADHVPPGWYLVACALAEGFGGAVAEFHAGRRLLTVSFAFRAVPSSERAVALREAFERACLRL